MSADPLIFEGATLGAQGSWSRQDRYLDSAVSNFLGWLPPARQLLNLCRERSNFIVAWVAAAQRGQPLVLPPDEAPSTLAGLARSLPQLCWVSDDARAIPALAGLPHLQMTQQKRSILVPRLPAALEPDPDAVVVLLHTSGSQGDPQRHAKTWGELKAGAIATGRRFGLDPERPFSILATVPPQHMFGLEMSILLPLVFGAGLHPGRPLFAVDVRDALAELPAPRILVTTPTHLCALVASGLEWPECEFLLLATAPLSRELAEQAESIFRAPVREVYGSTETGAIASRRPTLDPNWCWYDELQVESGPNVTVVSGGHLIRPFPLNDEIRPTGTRTFQLLGRHGDMIKIAGKRASLADLNRRLLQIPGVDDGAFLLLTADPDKARVGAAVVAPGLSRAQLIAALQEMLDPVFLPRPLRLVDRLPRNASGKLPAKDLLALIDA